MKNIVGMAIIWFVACALMYGVFLAGAVWIVVQVLKWTGVL